VSEPFIRLLADDDLDAALALSTTAGWNQRLDDWRMLLRLAPLGSFAALAAGHIVGTAIGIDYGGFAWIAMMLVDPAHRGRGIGRGLLEAAMGAVPSDRPIRLDATPLGRPLYERYGFEDEAMLTRHIISAAEPRGVDSRVRQLTAADLKSVTEHDNEIFGGHRDEVLEWALRSAPQYGLVIQSDSGLAQYCFGRQGRLFDQIGPMVAGHDDIARALMNGALAAAGGRPVVVDAFDSHGAFTASLGARGFQVQRPLFRMCRPSGQGASSDPTIGVRNRPPLVEFAILGPEFG
jgi:GNAT superfamily N-acetyltransferase